MKQLRSLLLVSPHNPEALERAYTSGADCIIIDLMGSCIAECMKNQISCVSLKETIANNLAARQQTTSLFVRISHPETQRAETELRCFMSVKPEAVLLPRAIGHKDVACLSAILSVLEAQYGIEDGATGIIAASGETAAGIMASHSFQAASSNPAARRLRGLSWDEIALSSELGTEGYTLPPEQRGFARSMTLMAARAAGISAFDTPSLQQTVGLFAAECDAASAAGYDGKIALYPEQVAIINEKFS